jgi:hypothetical protein
MGSEYEQIESLMRYVKRIEDNTMPNFEKYRKTAKLLDDCRAKKFPHMERLGLIEQHQPEEEENT